MKALILSLVLAGSWLLASFPAEAASVQASWDAVTLDVNGGAETIGTYVLYWGFSSRPAGVVHPSDGSFAYDHFQNVGNVVQARLDGLQGGRTYYFSVSAVDAAGNRSDYSIEATITLPSDSDGGPVDGGVDGGKPDGGVDSGPVDAGGDSAAPSDPGSGVTIQGSCGCGGAAPGGVLGWLALALALWLLQRRKA